MKKKMIKSPKIIAMVGVSGAGSSALAKAFKKILGWGIVEKNEIRVKLRNETGKFTPKITNKIFKETAEKILASKRKVILDSDFVEKDKREWLMGLAKKYGAKIFYLRIVCDRDVMLERQIKAKYDPKKTLFKNAAIAVREHCRRYPWHYQWSQAHGGEYKLRRLPIKFFAVIDTTKPTEWQKTVKAVAKKLRRA